MSLRPSAAIEALARKEGAMTDKKPAEWASRAGEIPLWFPEASWQIPDMGTMIALQPVSWQRMAKGIDDVKRRLELAAAALQQVGVAFLRADETDFLPRQGSHASA